MTKAIIRKWKDGRKKGGIVIVLPEEPMKMPETCKFFQFSIEEGAASYDTIIARTATATPKEAKQLIQELGQDFEIIERSTKAINETRERKYKERYRHISNEIYIDSIS